MTARTVTLIFGLTFLAIGFLGFAPGLLTPFGESMTADQDGGSLFGVFPVNPLHNLVHIGFGIWGLAAYGTRRGILLYLRATAVIYAVLAVFGLIPRLNDLFGLVPLYGHDVWLHTFIALVTGYFGFIHKERAAVTPR